MNGRSPARDFATLGIIVGADDDAYDVDDLPDEEAAGCDELENSGDDFTGVEAVKATQADDEDQAGEDERDGA